MRDRGVRQGDRVVGYIGNRPEALVSFLACAALGATWAVCNQDVSAAGAAVRFAQLEPKVLLTSTSSRYGGRHLDHGKAVEELVGSLPSLTTVLLAGTPHAPERLAGLGVETESWEGAIATARKTIGATNPADADPGSLRGSYALAMPNNLVHGSDSPESAAREIGIFFPGL